MGSAFSVKRPGRPELSIPQSRQELHDPQPLVFRAGRRTEAAPFLSRGPQHSRGTVSDCYSARSASIASTRVARRAGI